MGVSRNHACAWLIALICLICAADCPADPPPKLTESAINPTDTARFLGKIRLTIDGLDANLEAATLDPHALRLYLSGREMTDSKGIIVDRQRGVVEFPFRRTLADQQAWGELVGAPAPSGRSTMTVGTGLTGGKEFPYSPTLQRNIEFQVFGGLTWLAVVASAALVFIWASTQDYNGILTADALTLLGISAGAGATAVAVDGGKSPAAWPTSQGFVKDLLTDVNGVTWYRFQIVVWTLSLGIAFVVAVYQTLVLPSFDSKILLMMGISGGLYAGFKWPEKQV
jgi:hypothetical protein